MYCHNMFVIHRERRIECQAVGDIAVQFEKSRVRCQQSGVPEICLLRFWHINQFPDGIILFFFIWINCILRLICISLPPMFSFPYR